MSAAPEIQAKYLPCYEDPRTTPDFPGDCCPAERDGESAVPENVTEAKARFKAVYARRNVCARALSRLQPGDPARPPLAAQVLLLTEAIDHLEDVYAPIGFVAEPVMDGGMFTRELIFSHAPLASSRGEPFESSFSFYISIPLEDPEEREDPHAS
jgi:hypothetical protein